MKQAFVGVVLAAPAIFAAAAPLQIPTNVPIVEVSQQTNTYTYVPVNETNSTVKRVVPISDALVTGQNVSDVEPKVSTTRRLPIGTGADVTANVKIPKKNIAKALVNTAKGVGKLALPGVAGLALDALLDYGLKNVKLGDDGQLTADGEQADAAFVSDGRTWKYGSKPFNSKEQACAYGLSTLSTTWIVINLNMTNIYSDVVSCVYKVKIGEGYEPFTRTINISSPGYSNCLPGYYVWNDSCTKDKPTKSMREEEILDHLAAQSGWPSSAARALQGMLGEPSIRPSIFTPDLDQNLTLQGPNSATGKTTKTTEPVQLLPGTNTVAPPGTPSSQTQPGTKTTTTTKTHPITYSGNSVSYTTNNTTNNSITNNVTNVTTNETKVEKVEDDKEEQMPVDSPLGDVPKLYEKKYPNGLLGVWNAKKSQFEQTSFFRMIGDLTPKIGQAGSCPSWSIDLSWTPGGSMGVHQLQPPCMIWPILKAIVIISALFLARALIFGG